VRFIHALKSIGGLDLASLGTYRLAA